MDELDPRDWVVRQVLDRLRELGVRQALLADEAAAREYDERFEAHQRAVELCAELAVEVEATCERLKRAG